MNEINVDSLSIEIKTSADKAVSSIDSLAKSLDKLKAVTTGLKGLTRVANQIKLISDATSGINVSGLDKLAKMTANIEAMSKLPVPNFSKTANSLNNLSKSLTEINSISDLSQFTKNISEVVTAVKPFETLGKNTLSPFISTLRNIPKVVNSLDTATLEKFQETIKNIVASIQPLADSVNRSEKGLSALNGILQATTRANGANAASNAALVKSYTSLWSIINRVKVRLLAYAFIARRAARIISEGFMLSNQYVENLNLFTVAMGEAADEAFEFAQAVNDALGIDTSEWIRNQGIFKQITTGFGVIENKANLMSKNLTQIGYDISSFFNIDIEEAMQKVQSGISGELEPLRRLGYALDAATLQQIAYDNGIRQNINTMTQAQKSQLRYVAILQQSTNVMGDMARTIVTPANSMRIMNQQIMQFKRAIGNVVSVLAVKIIPYLQVGIRLLTDFANYLANLWGFKLPEIDYSKVGNGLSAVEDDADDATDAVKDTIKAVQRLAGFDEINVLKSAKEDADDTAAALGNQFDLGIDLPEYDFLQGVENSTEELYQKVKAWLLEVYEWLKKHKDLIKTIAKLIAGIWVVNKISKFADKLTSVFNLFKKTGKEIDGVQTKYSSLRQALGVTFGTIATSLGSFNFFKDLTSGAMDASSAITELITVGGGLAVAFASGGVVGGVLATIGGVIFGIAGTIAGFNEKIEKTLKLINDQAWKTGGLNISDAANIIDEYATTLTSSETKLLEDAAKIKTLRDDIKDINSNIDILFESIRNTDEVDTSAVDKIKDAFNELTTATKNYFTQNGDMLKVYFKSNESMFEGLGMTYSQFSKAIDNATGNASKNIENLQKELDTILSKDNLTSEDFAYIQTLEDRIRAMTGLNVDESTKQINELTNSIKSLASVPVNLESADTAKKSIDKMTKSVGTALKTLNDAHQEAVNAVNVLYSAGGITADEKNSMIKSLNEIYDVKKLKLHDVTHAITDYGEQIGKALESVRQNYIEEAFDYNMADYQKMLDLQSKGYVGNIFSTNIYDVALAGLEVKYKDAIKKFNSYLKENNLTDYWVENTSDYITQQITLSSGMTYEAVQDFIKNHMTNAKSLLKGAIKILPLASSIKNLFSKSLSETKSPLSSGLKSFSESVLSNLFGKDTMTSAKNSIKSAYTSLWDNILATNQDGAQRTSSKLSNSIRSIWSSVKSSTSGSAKIAADEITKAFTANLAIPIGFSATLASQTQNAVNNTKSQITKSGSLLGDAFGTGFENSVDDAIRKAIQDSVIAAANVGSFVGAAATVGTSKGISNSNVLVDWFRKLKIPGFASGGIVDGDLFLANENGRAEFISSIGNKAAVANQDQMRSEIRQGVKEGMLEALSRQSNGGDIYVYLDSDEVAYRLERNTAANTKRTGGR